MRVPVTLNPQSGCYSALLVLPSADSGVLAAQLAPYLIMWGSCPLLARAKGQRDSILGTRTWWAPVWHPRRMRSIGQLKDSEGG